MNWHLIGAMSFTTFVVLSFAAICCELDAKRFNDSLNDETGAGWSGEHLHGGAFNNSQERDHG